MSLNIKPSPPRSRSPLPNTSRHLRSHVQPHNPPVKYEPDKEITSREDISKKGCQMETICCGRSICGCILVFMYAIMYLIFLATFTMILLYISLTIMKTREMYLSKSVILEFTDRDIGLTATPTAENDYPVIWYQKGEVEQYKRYISALDNLFEKRRRKKREVDARAELGPCGEPPYGYGDNPCVIIRINKEIGWSAKPLTVGSPKAKQAPKIVQDWVAKDRKLWLHCDGINSYDNEHLGEIKYYPDPPGFDHNIFPMNMSSSSPLVGVQFTGFTMGVSLAIKCTLWHEENVSSISFVLYVTPERRGL